MNRKKSLQSQADRDNEIASRLEESKAAKSANKLRIEQEKVEKNERKRVREEAKAYKAANPPGKIKKG